MWIFHLTGQKRHGGTSTPSGMMENRSDALEIGDGGDFDEGDDLDAHSHICPDPACGLSFSTV